MAKLVNPSEHPELELLEQLWNEGLRATQIVKYLDENGLPPVKVTALSKYGQRNWSGKVRLELKDNELGYIEEVLTELASKGMKASKSSFTKTEGWGWEKIDGVNTQVPRETVRQSIEIIPDIAVEYERATIPDVKIVSKPSKSRSKPSGWELGISLPDMQIGFHRDSRGVLTTTHDESAIDVAHQIILFLEEQHGVDLIVNKGDNLDFPEFSTHRTAPGYLQNTKLTIDRGGLEAKIQRELAPNSTNVWLEGNHEARLTNVITDKIPSLVGLARAGEYKPVNSVSYLCRFEEYGMEYLEGYPEAEFWANEGLRFVHGHLYSSTKGGTANKYLAKGISTIHGHTHRAEMLWGNRKTKDGGHTVFAGSAGCLCRTDGTVPSASTGITGAGKQNSKKKTEDWQQGIFVVWYEVDGLESRIEHVMIEDGKAIFRGIEFNATVDPNGEKL